MSIDRLTDMTPEKIGLYNELCKEFEPYATISHKYWFEHKFTYNLTQKECIDSVIEKTIKEILNSVQIDCYYDYFHHITNKCNEGIEILEKFIRNNKAEI